MPNEYRRQELEDDLRALYEILDFYAKRGAQLGLTPADLDAYIDEILDEINRKKRELNDEPGRETTSDS